MNHDFAAMREAMVESQLRTTGVDDVRVVKAMANVPREQFVPEARRATAYAEMLVPLGDNRRLNLPMATGRMLAELALRPGEKLLIIGAATGYAAAVCDRLGAAITALESAAGLLGAAREALAGQARISLVEGPLAAGWPDAAPYDAILVDGAVEQLPDAFGEQLAEGGRLAGAVLENGVARLVFGRRQGGAFGYAAFADVASAPLPGFERARAFSF